MEQLHFLLALVLSLVGPHPGGGVARTQGATLQGALQGAIGKDCTLKGKKLQGRVKVVDAFPDLRVAVVSSFPDLKVEMVQSFPDACGRWQLVESFPDFTIQYVESFPDLRIQKVTSFPGLPSAAP